MQEQKEMNLELELQWLKERLVAVEEERDQAMRALRDAKNESDEHATSFDDAFATQKIYTELNTVKKLMASTTRELKFKQNEIELLKSDVEIAKKLELTLEEKEAELQKLNEELMMAKKKIQQLEHQLEKQKESEAKVFESLVDVTKQLEQTKIGFEELRYEVCSLQDKYDEFLQKNHVSKDCASRNCFKYGNPMSIELRSATESLIRAQEGEKEARSKARGLSSEIGKLRNELKEANNAEVISKKAMDDLVIALSEVVNESNRMKAKLDAAKTELENSRREIEELRSIGRAVEEKYETLIEKSRKEAERNKKTTLRLQLEAEKTRQTWNEMESGLVRSIREAKEDKTMVQQENIRLLESLGATGNMVRVVNGEKNKLRDILKQVVKEANAAKEDANIAKAEYSTLKDCLTEKDDALDFLTREVDHLRANEATEELKKLVSESSPEEDNRSFKSLTNNDTDSSDEMNKEGVEDQRDINNVDGVELLKGSIFDDMDSPESESDQKIMQSSKFVGDVLTPEDLDRLGASHLNDFDIVKFSSRRRRLLRKFGDPPIRRRSHAKASR